MASAVREGIMPHNARSATVWGSRARGYRLVTWSIADGIESCVTLLDPKPHERILDVATGTGNAARHAAARGPQVVATDFSQEFLDIAKEDSPPVAGLKPIEFQIADAENLPFPAASFDAVLSTFGVMFASNHLAAASELSRVVKPGGRLALTCWTPDSTIAGMFAVQRQYMPAAAPGSTPPASPFRWGDRAYVQELLGEHFDLRFQEGNSNFTATSGLGAWELFYNCYGPTKTLADSLVPERLEAFKQDFAAFHEKHRGEIGISMPRKYLIILGTRMTA
eukprot:TRINITY_DN8195_c0_g1_i1.p1 TRINITY_DN8195_c0_g1~~TRINITY_DN8195_c0_g1_i1.p1  ORF type:complete len:300 (+),score=49.42 TRINITY_DN8195_c0_g1_i1:63-902(+)